MNNVVLQYKRSRKWAAFQLILLGITFPAMFVLIVSFFPEEDIKEIYAVAQYALAVLSIVLFMLAWWNYKHPALFEFTITDKRIESRYPDNYPAWTYSIAVDDVIKIEIRTHAQNRPLPKYYLVTRDGGKYEIPINYNNPVHRIGDALQKIKPGLKIERTVGF
jgi:hypothetical protein